MRGLNPEDYIGKTYNHLTVLRKLDEKKNGCYLWEFQCDCGNLYKNKLAVVKNGNTKSCGCQKASGLKEYNENNRSIKIGDKFGKLTILEEIGLRPYSEGHSRMWYKCICECGQITEKCGNLLKQGQVKSCGCLKSNGEEEIKKILDENSITYKMEYVDEGLLKETGHRLRFDFAIIENDKVKYYIEFQGRQHYQGFDEGLYSNSEPLSKIQERDNIKREYCKRHLIPLIEIPYTMLGKITINDLLEGR